MVGWKSPLIAREGDSALNEFVINITGILYLPTLPCKSCQIVEQHHRVTNNIYANQEFTKFNVSTTQVPGSSVIYDLSSTSHKLKYIG
jgi:hypothetical protein